tara:strand:+ start:355 stop:750 length:396 start_codon:yes stop_codon:yes gene_type:complete
LRNQEVKMNQEKKKIETTIQTYYDSMYFSDGDLVRKIFHQDAKITGYLNNKLLRQSVEDFASFVEQQKPSPKEKEEKVILEILSLDIEKTTAVAKVRDNYLGMIFIDTLSLIKIENNWQIYNKLFEVAEKA